MDTISMLLTGWIIFIFCSVALTKFLYMRFIKKRPSKLAKSSSVETLSKGETELSTTAKYNDTVSKTLGSEEGELRKRIIENNTTSQPPVIYSEETIKPTASTSSSTICTGPDPKVVNFVTDVHNWLFSKDESIVKARDDITSDIIDAMNRSLRNGNRKVYFTLKIQKHCSIIIYFEYY